MKKLMCAAVAISIGAMSAQAVFAGNAPPIPDKKFSREEFMVMNLNRGEDSTGAHINSSIKEVRIMVKDLDRSLRQLQQVDREFAKSKGKPDDKFLSASADRLQRALKTAQQLSEELEATREELKDNIHNALLMAQ